jgi:translation initiation factor 5B
LLPDAEAEAENRKVQIFNEQVVYHVIENYLAWLKKMRESALEHDFDALVKPGKLQILEGYVFRRARPAIFGVEILAGKIAPKVALIRAENGEEVGEIEQIQDKGKALTVAERGVQVAVSMDKPVVGRHVFEKDVLFVKVPEVDAKILQTKFLDRLTAEEQEALTEYVNIMRKKVLFWGA